MNREMVKAVQYHKREFTMYSQMIPALNKHWDEHSNNSNIDQKLKIPALMFSVCNSKEYCLVMENCKANGFEMNDKLKGLDLEQLMLSVSHLARLHALSYSYNQTTSIIEKFPCLKFAKIVSSTFRPIVLATLENVIRFLKTLPGREEMTKKMEKARHTIPGKFRTLFEDQSRHQIMCLTHGDFWNNNILFKYAEDGVNGEYLII